MAEAIMTRSMNSDECPVCFNSLTNPLILSCKHIFCKTCLENILKTGGDVQKLPCPLCRAETKVKNQDLSKLPAYIFLKSRSRRKMQYQFCKGIVNAVAKNIALPTKDSMNVMVSTPDGRMAVGCGSGGVEIFSADGQHHQPVLKHVEIRRVGFISDDRYVAIDSSNNITLHTLEYKQLNAKFDTLGHDEGGLANLTVDDDDQIYVSYRLAKKIQVFLPAGGKAIWEIPCDGFVPNQITMYNDYLITVSWDTIRLIDTRGVVKYKLSKFGHYLTAAVSQGNTILIATVNHNKGLVCIDEYTNELKHVQKLVNFYEIEKPGRYWYYLQQFQSGEIAFCTPDRLYVFPWITHPYPTV